MRIVKEQLEEVKERLQEARSRKRVFLERLD